jgi:transcriptional regulator with XRE-family HTH domain
VPRPLVDPQFGVTLRRLRTERAMSLRALAAAAVFGKSYLHDLETGAKTPTGATAQRLDEVLDAGGQLTALIIPTASPPRMDGERLAYGVAHPRRLDAADVTSLATVLAHQRRLEDAIGSAPLVAPVLAQATLIRRLVSGAPGTSVWPRLMEAAAEWACYAGWLTATTGRHALGRRWYRQSQTWAEAIEHPDLTSNALQMQGHLAWVQERHTDMLTFSRAAGDRARSPAARSVAVQQQARALALVGDARGCRVALGEAEDLAQKAADEAEGAPDWLYFYDGAFLTMQRGLAEHYLGRHETAVDNLTAGLARLPDDVRCSDWVSWYLVRMAESQAGAGDRDAAASSLRRARAVGERTSATRLLADVDGVARRLGL